MPTTALHPIQAGGPRRFPYPGARVRLAQTPAILLVLAGVAAGACTTGPDVAARPPATVLEANAVAVRVVDGDTLVVAIGDAEETTRLIGIDTPETKKPDTPIECYGTEASERLAALAPAGTPLLLERDQTERDRYGRLLAYAHRATDGLFLNEAMVAEGFAATLPIPPNDAYARRFAAAAREAGARGAGLWSACDGPHAAVPEPPPDAGP